MHSGKRSSQKTLLIFFALAALLLAACGGGSSSSTSQAAGKAPADQQILVLPLSGYSDVATFDPALATDYSAITPINMVFTGLVQLDDHLQVHDELAASHRYTRHSITSLAEMRSAGDGSRPRALAVLRLSLSSNLTGA